MISYMVKVFLGFVKNLSSLYKVNKEKVLSAYSLVKVIIIMALLQTVVVESLQRGSLSVAFLWLYQNPQLFFLNCFLVILVSVFFISLTGSLRLVVFFSTFTLIFISLTNLVKLQFLGEPLFPWDFIRIDQVINLLPKYFGEIAIIFVVLALMILGLVLFGRIIVPRCKVRWFYRVGLFLALCLVIPILIFYRHTPLEAVFKKANIEHLYWIQGENILHNGFLLGFTMNIENTMIFQPDDYSADEIRRIVSENTSKTLSTSEKKASGKEEKSIKPNIVFVLSESFWDPTKMTALKYSEDPIPFFRSLQNKGISGTMISPVFGGSTANVEFEILTGLSTKFLPQGAIAYQQYIEKQLPSVPRIFKADGYATKAIHPYHAWFYKRDKVFKLLGFDDFYNINDFKDTQFTGEYIGDIEVSKKIVAEIKNTNNPAFVFAITMQNHGPYQENRYEQNVIKVEGDLSPEGKSIIETYVQGLRDGDNALKYLVENFKEVNEPTIVVFLGDHLPYLGKEYLVYKEAGFISESENKWSPAEKLTMKSVPYVIWSNFEYDQEIIKNKNMVSAQYLSNYLLILGHQQPNTVLKYVKKLENAFPVFSNSITIDAQQKVLESFDENALKLENDYWLLEYDLLFGNQYANLFK